MSYRPRRTLKQVLADHSAVLLDTYVGRMHKMIASDEAAVVPRSELSCDYSNACGIQRRPG